MLCKMENMHTTMFHKEKNRIWQFLFVLLWCMQMLTAVYFCCQKQGFHEDEYYTYYSTARTFGLNIEDNAWMEHDTYFNEFTVLRGEQFQYGLVKQVQSWDVHPPVYYWIFHTISSFFPEKFSKWYGLGLNLAAYGLSMFLLWILCLKVTGNNEKLSLFICLFYGFTPAVMSSVVFIRMYALLTVFVLLCAILHVGALEYYDREDKDSYGHNNDFDHNNCNSQGKLCIEPIKIPIGKFLFPLALVTYLGFLTQYYYFIFLFFMAVVFCIFLLWKDRNLWNCIRYAISLAITFVLAYLTYPAFPGQMFKGQRGAQATGNFFDLSNTLMRLEFFYQLLDEYVFGKILSLLLIVIIVLMLYVNVKKKINILNKEEKNAKGDSDEIADYESKLNKQKYFILLFTAAGYFFVVSKTALLLGETSIRYQVPIYGIVVLLIFTSLDYLIKQCYRFSGLKFNKSIKFINSNLYNWVIVAAALIAIIVNISGFFAGRVVFLYPEDTERVAFAKEKAFYNIPIVYVYDEVQSWCVWDAADELFEYDRVYFASLGSSESITDSAITESSEVVVYLNNSADPEVQLGRIMESSPGLAEYELMYSEKYCDVYYLHGND